MPRDLMRTTWDNRCLHQFLRSGERGERRWCCVWTLMLFRLQEWISISSGKIKSPSKERGTWGISVLASQTQAAESAGGSWSTSAPRPCTCRSGISRSGVGPGDLHSSCQAMPRRHLEEYWLLFSHLWQPSFCTLMCLLRRERVCGLQQWCLWKFSNAGWCTNLRTCVNRGP